MKRLFWKEWRENWLVVVCMPLLLALCMIGYRRYAGTRVLSSLEPAWLFGIWLLSAIVTGAGLFAREIGNETLGFLLAQPVSRRRLWAIKSTAGLGVSAVTALATWLVWDILRPPLFGPLQ
ncbi:MAG TPA: hypothetical protein VFJ58_17285, partial [Armatimonadota bacterium]|nr:hypothetical protein [Armatimonadota bacterium]